MRTRRDTRNPLIEASGAGASSARAGAYSSMQHRRKADQPDDDEIDRDDVVEEPRHDQDQDAGDEGGQGLEGDMHGHGVASFFRGCWCWGLCCRGRGYVTGIGLMGWEWFLSLSFR